MGQWYNPLPTGDQALGSRPFFLQALFRNRLICMRFRKRPAAGKGESGEAFARSRPENKKAINFNNLITKLGIEIAFKKTPLEKSHMEKHETT